MPKKICFAVSTLRQIERLIEFRKSKFKTSIIFIKYFLIKGFGIEWLRTFINHTKNKYKIDIKDDDPHFFKTPYGCQDAGCYAVTGNTAKILVNKTLPFRGGADSFIGMCLDRYFLIKNFYISKINLSFNGSIAGPGGIYKGYTENNFKIPNEIPV